MDKRLTTKRLPRLLFCGACLAGNMGGPAMYLSMAKMIEDRLGPVEVTILSKYPEDDRQPAQELNWRMISFPTTVQLFLGVPFSILYGLLRFLRLPRRWLASGPFEAYLTHDLLIDFSGISFSDDRPFSGLIINALWLLPAIAIGSPWMKASQAMGPFNKPVVRCIARWVLSRAQVLVARGQDSYQFVKKLLPGVELHELPDVAFVLEPATGAEVDRALAVTGCMPGSPYCVIGPSQLVNNLVDSRYGKGTYARLLAKVADRLIELSGQPVLLMAHARATAHEKVDDLDVAREVAGHCQHGEKVFLLSEKVVADVLKGIVARAEVAVGSRFHFMVATLSSGVPGMAITWSHKYLEMMRMLGQERFALQHEDLTEGVLLRKVDELWQDRQAIHDEICKRLPGVKEAAAENARLALKLLAEVQSKGTIQAG